MRLKSNCKKVCSFILATTMILGNSFAVDAKTFALTASDTAQVSSSYLKLSQTELALTNATPEGKLAATANVIWSSSNTSVATVTDGVVTAQGNGTATITASPVSGSGTSVSCTVTVTGYQQEASVVLQENVISQTANSVTIGRESLSTGGLFITSDMSKTTFATVGYAGDMPVVDGKAQFTITNKPVMEGAGFTNEPLSAGDQFKYWIRVHTSTGEKMEGPFEYTHPGTKAVAATGITINPAASVALEEGEIYQLAANITPEDATDKDVVWTSSNTNVVTVGGSKGGLLTAVAPGTAVVTVKTSDGKFSAACKVQVGADIPATGIVLSKTSLQVQTGLGLALQATVLPENATNTEIVWTSEDSSIAIVNNGVVTGIKEGKTTVTATVAGTAVSAACEVTVTKSSGTGQYPGGSVNTGPDGKSPAVTMTCSKPEVDETLQSDGTFMYFTLCNNTDGKYTDDQVFVTILGREWNDNAEQPFSYLTADGKLPLISTRTNDKFKMMYNPWSGLVDTKREFTNLGFTIADLKALGQVDKNGNAYVKVPPIRSGRMFVSYGEDICIQINGADFSGPALENPTDPNQGIVFDFVEFTYNNIGEFWGNTTRVDGYVFPISIRLTGTVDDLDENGEVQWVNGVALQKDADIWAGDLGNLEEIYARWDYDTREGTLFEKFNHLLVRDNDGNPVRIKAPGKGEFDSQGTGIYTDYYNEYVNYVWDMYTNPYNPDNPMVFTTQAGRFVQTGIAASAPNCNGSYELKDGSPLIVFKREVWNEGTGEWYEPYPDRRYYIHKPSTGEVLEGKGAFDHHHEQGYDEKMDLVIQSQLCAAFNRGVAHLNEKVTDIYSTDPNDPTGINSNGNPIAPWGDVARYYVVDDINKGVFNYYAKFWHEFGVDGKAYGYCYDDVWEQSTLLYVRHADVLAIDFYSYGGKGGNTDPEIPGTTETPDETTPSVVEPSIVTGVTATYADGEIKLTWDDNGATMYKVVRSDGRSGYENLTYSATSAGWTDSKNIVDAQLYYYRVIGYFKDADGNLVMGPQSDAAAVVATDRLPAKVVNVKAAQSGQNVTLTWDKADGARYYKISRAAGATGQYYTLKYNIDPTSYTDSNVAAGLYRYKVVGYYKDVDGGWVYGDLCDTLYVTVK